MGGRGLALCVAAAIVLRLVLLPLPGFRLDIAAFESWARALAAVGPGGIYVTPLAQPPVDYPPLYLYVLWVIGSVQTHATGALARRDVIFRMLVKVPAVVADLAAAALVYRLTLRAADARRAACAGAAVLLAPPAWLDSAYWGQIDAVPAALLLAAALLSLEKRWTPAWLVLALAILIKPQGVVLLPLLAAREFAVEGFGPRVVARLIGSLFAASALAYALSVPFAPNPAPLSTLGWLAGRYAAGVNKAPHNSEGAFNVYTIVGGFYRSDATPFLGMPLHLWGVILVAGSLSALALALFVATRRAAGDADAARAFAYAATLALAALFLFGTRMHERYLLAALFFGATVAFDGVLPATAVAALALSFTVNCSFILAGFSGGAHHPLAVQIGHAFALLNLACFAALAIAFTRRTSANLRPRRHRPYP